MIKPGHYPAWTMPFAAYFEARDGEEDVWSPSEGFLSDAETRQTLFDILTKHTAGGADTPTTAFHWRVGPRPVDSDILRGPLRAWPELYRDDQTYSPQNIWPDTHEWVLHTDPDMWATAISGTPDRIENLIRSPQLEVVRLRPFA